VAAVAAGVEVAVAVEAAVVEAAGAVAPLKVARRPAPEESASP